ncbi:hypothetical protein STANM309S_00014 [Streptomyces tanashiensis]
MGTIGRTRSPSCIANPAPVENAQRVQDDRAVAVGHAFGVAGGTGGVAERRRFPFVEVGPVEAGPLGGEECVPAVDGDVRGQVRRGRVADDDDVAYAAQPVPQRR